MGAGTWLITEAEKQEDGDWKLFGFCHICEWEWGYLMLSDLQRIVLPGGLGIERDLYTQGRIVEDFIERKIVWAATCRPYYLTIRYRSDLR